jgi:NAD(P)-dependent dehydrogenase (short-subunit alcohol dehydrogenase family)
MSAVTGRKAALVTGGAVRLGRAIAISLAAAGYDIALHYNSSEAEALTAAADIRARGARCELFQHDLCQIDHLDSMIASVASKFPGLDVLVNSASAYQAGTISDTTPAQLDRLWTVNFTAPFFLMKEFCKRIDRGSIVNILDNKIAFNQYHYAAYLISKKALADVTKMAALEFAPRIRVNGIAPGVVLPASIRSDEYLQWRHQGIPMSRAGHPDHVCEAIGCILANEFITGQILFVDGGEGMNAVGRNTANFRSSAAAI